MVLEWQKVRLDRRVRVQHWMTLGAVGLVLGLGLWLQPSPQGFGTHRQLGLPPCTTYFLTGRPCPSCGMTTSVCALLHGDFDLAWRANPFGIAFFLLLLAAGLNSLMVLTRGYGLTLPPRLSAMLLTLLVIGWILYGAIRFVHTPPVDLIPNPSPTRRGEFGFPPLLAGEGLGVRLLPIFEVASSRDQHVIGIPLPKFLHTGDLDSPGGLFL